MTNSGDSGTLTFDDIIDANPLLFRLHSDTSSNTYFDAKNKVLLSSRRAKERNKGQDISSILKGLDENPSLSTPFEPGAVARHITCWANHNTEPSDFISLSSNICFVWWDWKRRRSRQRREDDFFVTVLKSSELRGLAKLGTEIVNKWQHASAYNFAQAFDEVIVADVVRPSAILGIIPMSQLGDFVPSWWENPLASMTPGSQSEEKGSTFTSFRDFLRKSKAPADKSEDDCTRESIRFALALIAPMMVRGGQQHADSHNGSVVDPVAIYPSGNVAADMIRIGSSEMRDTVVEMDVD